MRSIRFAVGLAGLSALTIAGLWAQTAEYGVKSRRGGVEESVERPALQHEVRGTPERGPEARGFEHRSTGVAPPVYSRRGGHREPYPRLDDRWQDRYGRWRPPYGGYPGGWSGWYHDEDHAWTQPWPIIVVEGEGRIDGPWRRSTASYRIVRPDDLTWVEGRYEYDPEMQVIEGEFVEVHHPAVYRENERGELERLEPERVTREPKVRIVLRRTWVPGHYAPAGDAPGTATQPRR